MTVNNGGRLYVERKMTNVEIKIHSCFFSLNKMFSDLGVF